MIIGNGLLARAFAPRYADDPSIAVFASGVSNSAETDPAAFERERALLTASLADPAVRLLYYSSCALLHDPRLDTPYLRHKRELEDRVLSSPNGLVFRLPQVVGPGGNPHTLTNYINDRIMRAERFTVWRHAERNLIDVEHVARIVARMVDDADALPRMPICIASKRSTPMPEIVSMFERTLGKRAVVDLVDAGEPLPVDATHANLIAMELGIDLGHGYAESVIRTYYGTS